MPRRPSTLLVSAPWASTARPSLAVGTLTAAARRAGFPCEGEYLNLDFCARIGADSYELFSETPGLFGLGEHLFAVDVFGAAALDSDRWLATVVGPDRCASLRELRDGVIPEALDGWTRRLLDRAPDVVGFSCTFNQVMPSVALARRLKLARPELRVLLGGACVHGAMGSAYASVFDFVDHVFTGEADHSFVELLMRLHDPGRGALADIPGVTTGGRLAGAASPSAELDSLPVPEYADYFSQREATPGRGDSLAAVSSIPYESSRGCWWGQKSHCAFCGLNNAGMTYRKKSDDRVVAEIIELSRRYHSCQLMAADNILDFHAYDSLLRRLAATPAQLDLFYEIKANLRRADVESLAAAGVRWVQPGIESFASRTLSTMHKGISALQNVQTIKWLAEHGIAPSYNILVGFADEQDADFDEQLYLIERCMHLPPPSGPATIAQVHRFSPFFTDPEAHGIGAIRAESYYEHIIPRALLAPEEFAYFFARDLPEDGPTLRNLPRLNAALARWRAGDRRLHATLGAGFIAVRRVADGLTRQLVLSPAASLALALTDQLRPWQLVVERLTRCGLDAPAARAELEADGLCVVMGGRMLSVVPFERPVQERRLQEWVTRWFGPQAALATPGTRLLVLTSDDTAGCTAASMG